MKNKKFVGSLALAISVSLTLSLLPDVNTQASAQTTTTKPAAETTCISRAFGGGNVQASGNCRTPKNTPEEEPQGSSGSAAGAPRELETWERKLYAMPTREVDGQTCYYLDVRQYTLMGFIEAGGTVGDYEEARRGDPLVNSLCYDPADPEAARQTALARAQEVAAELTADGGTISTSPGNRGLVGLPTYVWINGVAERTANANAAGLDLTITATPTRDRWDFGDGTVITGGPGQPGEQNSDVSHTYNQLGRYPISATVTWDVDFQASGAELGPTQTAQTTTSTVHPVAEVRGILVN